MRLSDQYVITKLLGEGGQGKVFRGRQVDAVGSKPVVIKMARESAAFDDEERSRFLAEARRAMELGPHPNIVPVSYVGLYEKVPYLVMPWVDGADLQRVLSHYRKVAMQPIDVSVVCRVLADMATALDYAHFDRKINDKSLGLVHRDVKPANTLITFNGYAKILDFGISTKRSDERTGRFQYGTPRYMSQDHFYCRVSTAMDVYSLGVVAWEMLEGRVYRDGQPGFSGDFPWAVINLEAPSMERSGLPRDLIRLVEASLRPGSQPSAKEFTAVTERHASTRGPVKDMLREAMGRGARSRLSVAEMEIPDVLLEQEKGEPQTKREEPAESEIRIELSAQKTARDDAGLLPVVVTKTRVLPNADEAPQATLVVPAPVQGRAVVAVRNDIVIPAVERREESPFVGDVVETVSPLWRRGGLLVLMVLVTFALAVGVSGILLRETDAPDVAMSIAPSFSRMNLPSPENTVKVSAPLDVAREPAGSLVAEERALDVGPVVESATPVQPTSNEPSKTPSETVGSEDEKVSVVKGEPVADEESQASIRKKPELKKAKKRKKAKPKGKAEVIAMSAELVEIRVAGKAHRMGPSGKSARFVVPAGRHRVRWEYLLNSKPSGSKRVYFGPGCKVLLIPKSDGLHSEARGCSQ